MQVLQWAHATRAAEHLVAGEIRTVAITVTPDAPTSATVRVIKTSDGTELIASTAATVVGSVVSHLLTVPITAVDAIDVVFLLVLGAERVGVSVRIQVALR
jgi:hypothetical protein